MAQQPASGQADHAQYPSLSRSGGAWSTASATAGGWKTSDSAISPADADVPMSQSRKMSSGPRLVRVTEASKVAQHFQFQPPPLHYPGPLAERAPWLDPNRDARWLL